MNNVVYILSDHDEYGAENVMATLDPQLLPRMIDAGWENEGQRNEAKLKLSELLADPVQPSPSGHNLNDWWGGIQLHVVTLEVP